MTFTTGIRILYKDPRGAAIPPLYEGHSNVLSQNATDPTKQLVVPYVKTPTFLKDDVIAISVKPVAATIPVKTGSTIQIPVTIRNTRTNVVSDSFLVSGDFTEYNAGGSCAAAVWADWCYYTIPAGTELRLGHRYGFNSRIHINPCV